MSATRQSQLDASIQSRIKSELSRLKKQESDVRKQIELALEKENLDKESKLGKKGAQGRSSVLLKQQLDDISTKIEKHNQTREKLEKTPAIQKAREEVTKCYKCVLPSVIDWVHMTDLPSQGGNPDSRLLGGSPELQRSHCKGREGGRRERIF